MGEKYTKIAGIYFLNCFLHYSIKTTLCILQLCIYVTDTYFVYLKKKE